MGSNYFSSVAYHVDLLLIVLEDLGLVLPDVALFVSLVVVLNGVREYHVGFEQEGREVPFSVVVIHRKALFL